MLLFNTGRKIVPTYAQLPTVASTDTSTARTRGQSNLTKSASRGAHSLVRGHPRGSKFVPLNSWGRVSYQCSIVTIGLGCTVWPQCTRMTTNDVTTQPISISASFTNIK